MGNQRKAFTVEIEPGLAQLFTKQVEERGYTKYRAIEGAIRVFTALPPDIQGKLIANSIEDIYPMLVHALVDSEIQQHLDSLGPAKDKFLALLTQGVKLKRRKK